jgi:hypothetical protein
MAKTSAGKKQASKKKKASAKKARKTKVKTRVKKKAAKTRAKKKATTSVRKKAKSVATGAPPSPRHPSAGTAMAAAMPAAAPGPLDPIIAIASSSPVMNIDWPHRGLAPRGYIKGMAVVYARVYCKLKAGDAAVTAMAQKDRNDSNTDALSHYASQFSALGMSNATSGADPLRHLFTLMIGLGMRESSGRFCEGLDRDANPPNDTAEKAEAGMFQSSFNLRTASPLLPALFAQYSAHPSGFVDIFREGVTPKPKDLENFGTGPGRDFQKLEKECPAFAAEFTAVGLRFRRQHWGPINNHAAEVRSNVEVMLRAVQNLVDASPGLCAALA